VLVCSTRKSLSSFSEVPEGIEIRDHLGPFSESEICLGSPDSQSQMALLAKACTLLFCTKYKEFVRTSTLGLQLLVS
jgi:hypothetical protein